MQPLYERFRPQTWAEVIGQPKALASLDTLRRVNGTLAGNAYWISGPSGTGKTTIARLIASELADDLSIDEIDAETLTPSQLQDWERSASLRGFGRGGRVFIVNEAHGLKRAVIRQLLVTLERIPSHACWIFTTTTDGQENLFGEQEDAHPLLSRCVTLPITSQGLCPLFAERARSIAMSLGLDGRPIAQYRRLVERHRNNLRAVLQDIAAGKMLPAGGAE